MEEGKERERWKKRRKEGRKTGEKRSRKYIGEREMTQKEKVSFRLLAWYCLSWNTLSLVAVFSSC